MARKNIQQQKRFAPKLHVRKGDQVVVISGEYKGTEGEVMEVFPEKGTAIVEDVNIRKKAYRPTEDMPGGIREMPGPIRICKLMHIDPDTGERTRIGRRRNDDGKLVRFAKKSGELLD